MEEQNNNGQLQIELREEVAQGTYANLAIITHSSSEFILDFVRVAIARAVLKNAPIVILDESTAYIDAENEALIQEAMAKVIAGKTVLMIAHRLSTITDADKIVVIKDGQIIDEGTHENLLTSCTLYQEMWKAHMDTKDVA